MVSAGWDNLMAIKIKYLLVLVLLISLLVVSISSVVLAADPTPPPPGTVDCYSNKFLGFPTWYQYLELDPADECNVITKDQNYIPILIAMGILNIILYLAAFVSTIMVFYGGFRYLTSNGESGKITEGKNTIVAALIGLAIALIASQVVGFIAGKLA